MSLPAPEKTLRVTSAVAANVSKVVMTWEDFVALMDADAPKSGTRGPYKKSGAENSN